MEDDVFHSPEFIEGTKQGIADWRAGRVQSLSEVLAEMTQTIDFTTATASELIRWLAEQLCPKCDPKTGNLKGYSKNIVAPCFDCVGTVLAFPWASEECSSPLGCLRLPVFS